MERTFCLRHGHISTAIIVWRLIRMSLGQGLVYDFGGFGEHLVEGLRGFEGLGIHLVDVFGAGWACREPVVLGGDLQAADLGVVARSSVSLAVMSSPASVVAATSSPESLANFCFCSNVVGVSMRLYQLSPKRSTCS